MLPESLPDIDMATGLLMCNNNSTLYLNMLKKFRDSKRHEDESIRALLAAGDRETACRTAHSMKSVAGTLGATDLSAAARLLEGAIAKNQDDRLEARLDSFAQLLKIVINSLDAAFGEIEPPPASEATPADVSVDRGRLLELMRSMDAALDTDMSRAIDLAAELGKELRTTDLKQRHEQIQLHMSCFDIDAVRGVLRELSEKLTEV
jgi:HPt (histidine-containing phosphotransfer) domain-containing protein